MLYQYPSFRNNIIMSQLDVLVHVHSNNSVYVCVPTCTPLCIKRHISILSNVSLIRYSELVTGTGKN